MARRRRGVHRKRFGGWNIIWKFVTLALMVVAVVMALILFFKIENIRVEGEAQYTEQEVRKAAGIQIGDNLYLINKSKASDNVFSTLPYVRKVRIYRELPSTLIIEVQESAVAGIIITPEGDWVLNAEGTPSPATLGSKATWVAARGSVTTIHGAGLYRKRGFLFFFFNEASPCSHASGEAGKA